MPRQFNEETYLRAADKALKSSAKKEKDKSVWRFCYVNKAHDICLDTIRPDDGQPEFVLWNGAEAVTGLREFLTPEGDLLKVPPMDNPFYRDVYSKVVFPNELVTKPPSTAIVDEAITRLLKRWFIQAEEFFIVARNFIKYTWVYERFRKNPYINIYGDWGTGKTEWGKFLAWLSHYGYVADDISAAALVRLLDMTNCTIMLDEAEYADGEDGEKIRRILRNGYQRNGRYIVAEMDGKNYIPKAFLVDQPKIICKRQNLRDEALNSRVIPFKMVPHDEEIPLSMRRDDEYDWELSLKAEMTKVANLMLAWRHANIFGRSDSQVVDNLRIRYNDTISPLLKLAVEGDKDILISYIRSHQKQTLADQGDEFGLRVIKIINKIYRGYKRISGSLTPRVFLSEVTSQCVEEYSKETSEQEAKKFYTSRAINRTMKSFGFETDSYANKTFIIWRSLDDVMPKICKKYSIKTDEEVAEEANQEELANKQQEAERLLEEQEGEQDIPVDKLPF